MAVINNLKPFLNIGPGDIIKEQMEVRSWTQEDLSEILGISLKHINKLLQNKQPITLDMANYLSKAFNTSPQYWINLDTNYRLNSKTEENEKEKEIQLKSEIFSKMPVRELYKNCWLKKEDNFEKLIERILQFWKTDNLNFNNIEKKFAFLRKSEAYDKFNNWNLMCWMQMADNCTTYFKVKKYNKNKLEDLFESLHEYTIRKNGVQNFINDLNSVGVKFMLLYHLQRTYLDGASFLDKNNPVIAYTARYNRLDNFWFTVAHEIAHILLHLKNENDCFIDVMSKEYSGDKEKEADELASQKLYSNEILDFFKRDMDYITQSKIKQCSEIYKIHPAIIIGTLAYNKEISFKYLHLFNKDVKSLIPSIYKIEKYICKN